MLIINRHLLRTDNPQIIWIHQDDVCNFIILFFPTIFQLAALEPILLLTSLMSTSWLASLPFSQQFINYRVASHCAAHPECTARDSLSSTSLALSISWCPGAQVWKCHLCCSHKQSLLQWNAGCTRPWMLLPPPAFTTCALAGTVAADQCDCALQLSSFYKEKHFLPRN